MVTFRCHDNSMARMRIRKARPVKIGQQLDGSRDENG